MFAVNYFYARKNLKWKLQVFFLSFLGEVECVTRCRLMGHNENLLQLWFFSVSTSRFVSVHQVFEWQNLHRGSKLQSTVLVVPAVLQRQQKLDTSSDSEDGVRYRRRDLQKSLRASAEVVQAWQINFGSAQGTMHRWVSLTIIFILRHYSNN